MKIIKKIVFVILILSLFLSNLFSYDLEKLKTDLKNSSPIIRKQAITEILNGKIMEAGNLLIESLNDENSQVKISAIDALGILKINSAIPELLKFFYDQQAQVRQAAVLAIGNIADLLSTEKDLIRMLEDEDKGVKNATIRTLGKLKSGNAKEMLINVLNDKNEIMVKDAIWALGEIGDSSVRFKLYELLSPTSGNNSTVIKQEIMIALEKLHESDSIPYLVELFNDKDDTIKLNAAKTLAKLKSNEGQKYTIELLTNPDRNLRYQAVEMLGDIGNERCKDALRQVVQFEVDEEIKNYAKSELKSLGVILK